MRTIEISDAVWNEIAARGKFGEIEDNVLRRVFKLPATDETGNESKSKSISTPANKSTSGARRRSFATKRLSCNVARNQLHVAFQDGEPQSWTLPSTSDKVAIRIVRDKAVKFAQEHGATIGQINAVKKALTDNGYHLTK